MVYNQSKNRAQFAPGENNQIQLFETIFTYLEFQNYKEYVQKWGAKIMRSVRFVFKKLSTLIWILKMTHTHSNPIFGLNVEHQQLFDRANKKNISPGFTQLANIPRLLLLQRSFYIFIYAHRSESSNYLSSMQCKLHSTALHMFKTSEMNNTASDLGIIRTKTVAKKTIT